MVGQLPPDLWPPVLVDEAERVLREGVQSIHRGFARLMLANRGTFTWDKDGREWITRRLLERLFDGR